MSKDTTLILPVLLTTCILASSVQPDILYAESTNEITPHSINTMSIQRANPNYQVTANSLNVRKSRSTSSSVLTKINKGVKIYVSDISNKWGKVTINGKTGYIHTDYIKKISSQSSSTNYKVNTDDLNIRSSASASSKILGKLNTGDIVSVSSINGNWAKIKYKSISGYVNKKYIDKVAAPPIDEDTNKPPITDPTPPEEKPDDNNTNVNTSSNYIITTKTLNVRSKPSTNGTVLGKIQEGDIVSVSKISNGWATFKYKNKTAYVSSEYICKLIKNDTLNSSTILVNKQNSLSSTYKPNDLKTVNVRFSSGIATSAKTLRKDAAVALEKLFTDAKKSNITLLMKSGYRSYETQKTLYYNKVNSVGSTAANKVVAKAGQSEHQTGLSVDVLSSDYGKLDSGFAKTKAYKWIEANAHKYGFIIRYPSGKSSITGYSFEPWHLRFVGVNAATEIKTKGVTLEEYLR